MFIYLYGSYSRCYNKEQIIWTVEMYTSYEQNEEK